MDFRSVLAGGSDRASGLTERLLPEVWNRYPVKFWWFQRQGYDPHVWQAAFHGAADEDEQLTPYRHLVAGRRGGKTLSAAWEVLFYALHPSEFHRDAHGEESDRALWIWILAKDYPTGRASLLTLLDIMSKAGLVKGVHYLYNKTERRIEFLESGTLVEFKTADDPQSLRGAGLDILWIDEAAFVESQDAWNVVYPALTDREGLVITTTTPHGKNWFWELFFQGGALDDPRQFRVEYTSIDNPHFPRRSWEYAKKHYHPVHFKQEFLAAFDAMAGVALQGDWLKYWVPGNADIQAGEVSIKPYRTEGGTYKLRTYLGVDPAISLSDKADHFAIAALGVTEDNSQVFLLDYLLGRYEFPDQIDLIREWHLKWRPDLIGIESNAYQAALAQMASRLQGLPPIAAMISRGKKNDRILSMSPLFKIGKVRISYKHADFIDQWVNFDPTKKNQTDDLLDAVEVALSAAGVLLPLNPHESLLDEPREMTPAQMAQAQIRAMRDGSNRPTDPDLGSEA